MGRWRVACWSGRCQIFGRHEHQTPNTNTEHRPWALCSLALQAATSSESRVARESRVEWWREERRARREQRWQSIAKWVSARQVTRGGGADIDRWWRRMKWRGPRRRGPPPSGGRRAPGASAAAIHGRARAEPSGAERSRAEPRRAGSRAGGISLQAARPTPKGGAPRPARDPSSAACLK